MQWSISLVFDLKPYQLQGVEFLLNNKRCLLADAPGAGKTAQAIKAVEEVAKSSITNVLVLCPKSLINNWKREIIKWSDPAISYKLKYTVINYEKLLSAKHYKILELQKYDVFILDESHKALKSYKSKSGAALYKLLEKNINAYVWLITATTAAKDAKDYYLSVKILHRHNAQVYEIVKRFTDFQDMFCEKVKNRFATRGYSYTGFRNHEMLKKLFKDLVLKRDPRLIEMGLPPIQDIIIELDVPNPYSHPMSWFEKIDSCLDAGEPSNEVSNIAVELGLKKIPGFLDWFDSIPEDEPVVILCWHKKIIEALALELSCPYIHGDVSADDRDKINLDFQNGKIKRVILNYSSGGVGLNFSAARYCVLFELCWSPSDYKQGRGRIDRMDTKHKNLVYYIIMAKNTLDERIHEVLENKTSEIKTVGV